MKKVGYFCIYFNSIFLSECNVGHYKNGDSCDLCPGNTIKTMVGDAMDCNYDAACDGVMTVPNDAHTACGEQNGNLFTKINVKEGQTLLVAHDELI